MIATVGGLSLAIGAFLLVLGGSMSESAQAGEREASPWALGVGALLILAGGLLLWRS